MLTITACCYIQVRLVPLLSSSWRWLWTSLLSCWGWQQSRPVPPESRTIQLVYSNLGTLFLNHLDTRDRGRQRRPSHIQYNPNSPPKEKYSQDSCTVCLCCCFSRWLCVCTCHKVSESYSGQGDDHKVKGLQRRPTFDVFKDGCRERHEQQAAKQDKQQGGDDPDLCLADVPLLQETHTHKQRRWATWRGKNIHDRLENACIMFKSFISFFLFWSSIIYIF